MAGFNVQEFKSEVSKRNGIMRQNKFLMTFVPPAAVTGRAIQTTGPLGGITGGQRTNTDIGRSIEYWCESVALPGYQFMMGDTRRWTYGPIEKRPFAPNTVSLQSVFLSDGNGDMLKFFNSWMNNIIPHYVPNSFNSAAQGAGGMAPYEVRYKQEYATDLHIYVYRPDGPVVLHYIVKEAFPSHITDLGMNWNAMNDVMRISVTFDYLDWYLEGIPVAKAPSLNIGPYTGPPIGG